MKDRFDVHLGVTPTLFIGKWTVRVLFLLKERPCRHAQLQRRLGAVSQRMLTRTLRNLESTGLISRKVTQSRSVTVSYSLTKLGRSFMVPVNSVCRWIDRGAVRRLVGIEVGVVSGVFNLESPGVDAPGWRLRHEEAYHAA